MNTTDFQIPHLKMIIIYRFIIFYYLLYNNVTVIISGFLYSIPGDSDVLEQFLYMCNHILEQLEYMAPKRSPF